MQYVYVLKCGVDFYKVGIGKIVERRVAQLQTSNPDKIEVLSTRLVENAYHVEHRIHEYLKEHQTGGGTEWFRLTPEHVIEVLLMLSKTPEIKAAFDFVEAKNIMKDLAEHKRAMNKKLDVAIAYIKRKSDAQVIQNEKEKIRLIQKREMLEKNPNLIVSNNKVVKTDRQYMLDALDIIERMDGASASMLQRHLRIGYSKAARIIDALERLEIIGPADGARARVIINLDRIKLDSL